MDLNDISGRAERVAHEVRTFDVELRANGDGRTIDGLAAPFDSPTEIRDAFGSFTEVIRPGAFTRTITERGDKVRLYANHDRQSFPLGNIQKLWETDAGLMMSSRVANTTAGSDALALVAERVVLGLSIGFRTVADKWNDDYSEREVFEASLVEISLVAEPAYADAGVTAMRSVAGIEMDAFADALEALHGGDQSPEVVGLVSRVVDVAAGALPAPEPEPTVPLSVLEDLAALYEHGPLDAA